MMVLRFEIHRLYLRYPTNQVHPLSNDGALPPLIFLGEYIVDTDGKSCYLLERMIDICSCGPADLHSCSSSYG